MTTARSPLDDLRALAGDAQVPESIRALARRELRVLTGYGIGAIGTNSEVCRRLASVLFAGPELAQACAGRHPGPKGL
jgi:hypothetical protein